MRWFATLRARVHEVLAQNLTPGEIGRAVAVGVFVGVLPFYGLHIGMSLVLARVLKLNYAVVYGAANISNPLFAPFLLAGEAWLGAWLVTGAPPALGVDLEHVAVWTLLSQAPGLVWQLTVGGTVLGLVLAPLLGGLAWLVALRRTASA